MSRSIVQKEWVLRKVDEIIYNKFGTNLGTGEPSFISKITDERQRYYWIVPLEADYPRIIEDKRTGSLRYITLHIGKIGEIWIDASTGKPVKVPKRSHLNKTLSDELLRVRNKVERILIRTASLQFARLISLKHMLTPLRNLITIILKREKYILPDTVRGRKLQKFINLLYVNQFITIERGIIRPSPTLRLLFEKLDENYELIQEYVIKSIIENSYQTIYKEYKIRVLHPYIQISSSYYDYALSAQELISLSEEDLWEAYSVIYGVYSSRRRFRFDEYLRELSQKSVEILIPAGEGIWSGNEKIFRDLVSQFPKESLVRTI
ncbi:hypothetical protein DRJ16_03440 [Candidatus Woesearchaeota archaeon]|nr:MAG: hypothetical protein DRJ16_03440 [Candidatus Woesearchaeota archaeon]